MFIKIPILSVAHVIQNVRVDYVSINLTKSQYLCCYYKPSSDIYCTTTIFSYNIIIDIFCWICTKMIQRTKENAITKVYFWEKHISFGGLSLKVLGLPLCTFSHVSYFKHFTQETSVSTKHVYNLHFKKLDNSSKVLKALKSFQHYSICL